MLWSRLKELEQSLRQTAWFAQKQLSVQPQKLVSEVVKLLHFTH